jgi:hypothetical protein
LVLAGLVVFAFFNLTLIPILGSLALPHNIETEKRYIKPGKYSIEIFKPCLMHTLLVFFDNSDSYTEIYTIKHILNEIQKVVFVKSLI